MLKKILLYSIILLQTLTLYSRENVLIVTTKENSYQKFKNIVDLNSKSINYDVEVILVKDKIDESDYQGSKEYLNNQIITPPLFSFYIDEVENNSIKLYGFSKKFRPPFKVAKILLSELNLEKKIAMEFPLYLTSLIRSPEIQNIYGEYNIPILIIRGEIDPDIILKTLETDINYENIQTHYYIHIFFDKVFYINESYILYSFLIFTFLVLLLINLYSKKAKFHLKHNRKYLFTIPLKILMIYIFYFISSLVIEYVVNLSGNSDFLVEFPKTIFIIKHLILFFIYGISFHIIKDSSFSKSPYFYSHSSFYLSTLIYLTFCFIFLPLGTFFMWQVVIVMLYINSKTMAMKKTFVILSPIVISLIFLRFLNGSYSFFVNIFNGSSFTGNIILTILICPFIFLQESYYRFTHRRQNKIAHTGDIILSIITLTVTITLIAIILELK